MCGGQLLHVPCSRIGHVERTQPYSFPGGREKTEMANYKRAADVWMGDYSKYVYSVSPGMKVSLFIEVYLSEKQEYLDSCETHDI